MIFGLSGRTTATTLSFGRRHVHQCCAGEWEDVYVGGVGGAGVGERANSAVTRK